MKPLSPRQQRKFQEKKQKILDTAIALVEKEGLSGLTTHKLAKELDYTVGALYRYFPSKDVLLVEIQGNVLVNFHKVLKTALAKTQEFATKKKITAKQSLLLQIFVVAYLYYEFSITDSPSFRLLSLIIGDPRKLAEDSVAQPSFEKMQNLLTELALILEHAQEQKIISKGNNMQRALTLWAAQHGIMQLQKFSRFSSEISPLKLVEEFLTTLLLGWQVDLKMIQQTKKTLGQFTKKHPLAIFWD